MGHIMAPNCTALRENDTEIGAPESDSLNMTQSETISDSSPQFPIVIDRNARRNVKFPKSRHYRSHIQKRMVNRNGRSNVFLIKVPERSLRYCRDLATTLVHGHWRLTLLACVLSFATSWIFFATSWFLVSVSNGDLDAEHPNPDPCQIGIKTFAGFLAYSVESQGTIGYGTRQPTENCPEGVFLLGLQAVSGALITGAVGSVVFVKMIRPYQYRTISLRLFSKQAIISQRDGNLCLIFRVRDDDGKHSVGTNVSAYVVYQRNQKGEPFLQRLQLEPAGHLIWPLEVVHRITSSSPLWDLSARDLIDRRLEIIVTMQGTSATTGQCSQTRTSYLSKEILWGHRFVPCVLFDERIDSYRVNHGQFHSTYPVDTPLCSAQRLQEVIADIGVGHRRVVSLPQITVQSFDERDVGSSSAHSAGVHPAPTHSRYLQVPRTYAFDVANNGRKERERLLRETVL